MDYRTKASFFHNHNAGKIEAFREGIRTCGACGNEVSSEMSEPFAVVNCSSCDNHNLIPKKIGNFWLYYPLTVGNSANLYKAFHEEFPHRIFAVKILAPECRENPDLVKKLQNEADIVYKIGVHPCLFAGIESGFEDGEHYLAIEFIDADSLDKRLHHEGSLPETEGLMIALRLLSASAHIYIYGYLYRNWRPENITIFEPEGAYVHGYDQCLPINSPQIEPIDIGGNSLFYASPERILGEKEGAHSEIYSLGMLLYHMVTGQTYFSAEELKKLAIKLRGEYLTLSTAQTKLKDISSDVAAIITKMIRRSPEQRYQHYHEVELDILTALNNRF